MEYYSKEIYCGDTFINFVRKKHKVSEEYLKNHQILLLLYANEWFNYKDSISKFFFHPYLLKSDYEIYRVESQKYYYISLAITFGTTAITTLLYSKTTKLSSIVDFKKRFKIYLFFSFSLGVYSLLSFQIYKNNIKSYIDNNFQVYQTLDVDKRLIEKALNEKDVFNGNKDGFGNDEIDSFLKGLISINLKT